MAGWTDIPHGTTPRERPAAAVNRFQRKKTEIQLALWLRAIDKEGHIDVRRLFSF
jgi:hypothetical protein